MKIARYPFCLLSLFFLSSSVWACLVKTQPSKDLSTYEKIFLGKITAIHLIEYEKSLINGLQQDPQYDIHTDYTQEYVLRVIPRDYHKGSILELEELSVTGCGVPEPSVRDIGLFFVAADGRAHVVYETEPSEFKRYLRAIKK